MRKWIIEGEKFIRKGHDRMRAGVETIRDRDVCCSFQEKILNTCNALQVENTTFKLAYIRYSQVRYLRGHIVHKYKIYKYVKR